MNDVINNEVNELNDEFVIITKNQNDILQDVGFNNQEEELICSSIISNLEKTAAENIKNMKIVQLPFIGCVRINPVKRELRDFKANFKRARKYMTKEEYKDHVRSYVIDLKEKQKEKDKEKWIFTRTVRKNKKKYEELYKKLGKTYALLYIKSILWLRECPFDKDWEEQYQQLKD